MPVSKKYGEQSHYPLEQSRRCRWSLGKKIYEKECFEPRTKKEKL